jgi:lipoprotein-anchoring transpeptidase ErfK/SrfK
MLGVIDSFFSRYTMTLSLFSRRTFLSMSGAALVGACASPDAGEQAAPVAAGFLPGYGPIYDSGYMLPGIPSEFVQGVNRRITGQYLGEQPPGTIDVDPYSKFLYVVREGTDSVRFPVGVGRAGLSFAGNGRIQVKKKWPGWTPTRNMLRREPEIYGPFARGIRGGLRSPLGARALYLYKGGRDTYFRIHGTNDMQSIGNSSSAGCIRMFNQDIIALYDMIELGTPVHVRGEAEALRVDPENFNRGVEIPARQVDPELIYSDEAIANDPPPIFDDPRDGLTPGMDESNVPL